MTTKERILEELGINLPDHYIETIETALRAGVPQNPHLNQQERNIIKIVKEELIRSNECVRVSTKLEVVPTEMQVAQKQSQKVAVNVLSEMAEEMVEHFDHNGRYYTLKKEAPPTLEQSYGIIGKALGLHTASEMIESESCWILGNVIHEIKKLHGDEFDPSLVCEETKKAQNTVMTTEAVFEAFKDSRVPGASFSLHKEVMYTKGLRADQKAKIIMLSAKNGLTVRETRALAKAVASGERGLLDSTNNERLLEVAKRAQPKMTMEYILVKDTGEYRVHKGALRSKTIEKFDLILQVKPYRSCIKDRNNFFKKDEESAI